MAAVDSMAVAAVDFTVAQFLEVERAFVYGGRRDRIARPRPVTRVVLRDPAVTPTVREPVPIPIDRQPEVRLALRKSLTTANGIPLERRTLSVRVEV